jgi:hypothetical protein
MDHLQCTFVWERAASGVVIANCAIVQFTSEAANRDKEAKLCTAYHSYDFYIPANY